MMCQRAEPSISSRSSPRVVSNGRCTPSCRPSKEDGVEVSSYMELVNWLLRKYADEQSLSDQDALFHGASQEDGETESDFYVRLKG